jgi:hypothetical protein
MMAPRIGVPISLADGTIKIEGLGGLWHECIDGHWEIQGQFRPMIRDDVDLPTDLFHEAANEAKTMALAQARLDEADAVIAYR